MVARNSRPLWTCSRCRRRFANRNQTHACGRYDLAHHFRGKDPVVRQLYEAVRKTISSCGPVKILPEKTRIAFQVRMSFAQVTPRTRWLDGHFVLARRLTHARFRRIETFSPRNHVHHFRLVLPAEVDADFHAWAMEAYARARDPTLPRYGSGCVQQCFLDLKQSRFEPNPHYSGLNELVTTRSE